MKKVCTLLTAESAELERLAADALAGESGIECRAAAQLPTGPPDAALFIGSSARFFERQKPAILRLGRGRGGVVCVGPEPPAWLAGAEGCEWVALPAERGAHALELLRKTLLIRLKSAYPREPAPPPGALRRPSRRLVGVGASTGGPQVLLSILRGLPADTCGVLVVQHLSAGFSLRFSDYLDPLCAMRVKQAEDGEPVEEGVIYLAEDGRHLTVIRQSDCYRLRSAPGEKVNGFCPSADRLFESLAEAAGERALGVVLTGLGDDGARGLRRLRERGGRGIVQEEKGCAAPGMPRAALRLGGAEEQLSPELIAARILQFAGKKE